MKKVLIAQTAIGMMSFTGSLESKVKVEDPGDGCGLYATLVTSSCTRGCYSAGSFWNPRSLTSSELRDAEQRMEAYCATRPIVELIAPPPAFL